MARLFAENMCSLGRKMKLYDPSQTFGSTDMGNVSQLVPGIHPFVAIAPAEVTGHSPKCAAAAASGTGMKGMIDAAKALATTVVDLLSSPETLTRVKEEFLKIHDCHV
jgi:metal-dependent amidase/aminoacylase/carboxypeptidase family protein